MFQVIGMFEHWKGIMKFSLMHVVDDACCVFSYYFRLAFLSGGEIVCQTSACLALFNSDFLLCL